MLMIVMYVGIKNHIMEATQEKKSRKKTSVSDTKIKNEYMAYLLEHGKDPSSVYQFAQQLTIDEEKFYDHFNSFEGIQQEIWQDFFLEVKSRLESDNTYNTFSTREKVLSFYFTLFEVLKSNRSYVCKQIKDTNKADLNPQYIKLFKEHFSQWINDIIAEGKEADEIAMRPNVINDNYDKGFWLQTAFLINFWVKDNSKGFEKTDAAIEKSVNLGFDLIGKGTIDSILDFGKFMFQNKS